MLCCIFILPCLEVFYNFLFNFSLTQWLFKSMLFNFHILWMCFFFCWFLVSLHCDQKMYLICFNLLKFLRLVLWPNIWSVLEKNPLELGKNVYSAAVGLNVLHISVRFIWSVLLFKSFVSLLIFCLNFLLLVLIWKKKN